MNYYWATEGLGNNTKILDGYISSPKLTRDGKKLNFYDILQKVKPGDIIFSFTNKHIVSIGIAQSEARSENIPDYRDYLVKPSKNVDGWKINVKFKVISDKNQFFPLEHYRELKNDLPEKYSPLDKNGKGCNNAYFTQISENLKNKLIKLIGNEYLKIINELNAKSSTDTLKKQKDYENWLDKVKLIETDPPEKKYILKKKRGSIKGRKKITLKDLEHDKEIGDAGEDAVYRQELRIVEKYRNEKFLERVEHVSKDNDTLGYDIKSVTENGDDKYIEVKTTTQGKNTSFEISKGEINCSKEKGIKYYIPSLPLN